MKKFALWTIVLSFLIPFASPEAQPLRAEEVVRRLRESRERTKDFSADLLQEKKISLFKEKVISRGKIRFKKPDKVFIEFFPPEASQMLFDGKTFLLYFKEEKTAERYQIEGNPLVERYLLFSKDPFQERFAQWRVLEDRESFVVMEILPKAKDALWMKTRLWISKKDWMIIAMEMVEQNGDITTLRYSNMRVNRGRTDSDFEIRLPKEVRITEVR